MDGLTSELQLGGYVRWVLFPKKLRNADFLLTLLSPPFRVLLVFVSVDGSTRSVVYEKQVRRLSP